MPYAIIVIAVLILAGVGLVWFFRREERRGPIRASPPPPVFIPTRPPGAPELVPIAQSPSPVSAAGAVHGRPLSSSSARMESFPSAMQESAAEPAGIVSLAATSACLPDERRPLADVAVARTVVVEADGGYPRRDEEALPERGGRSARRRRRGGARANGGRKAVARADGGDSDGEHSAADGRGSGGRTNGTVAAAPLSAAAMGTLRMLPGRFEVVDGHPADRETRLVADPGTADQRFTMGRGEGPPNQHVRLQGQTVSRLHAALSFQDGAWGIENLSATNPLRVNGQEVDPDAQAMVALTDGDLIELGEVVLRFRA